MDLFKHFSHNHGLNFHQMPQGSKGQCSGCQYPVSGNVYACWQCNHFLHEQCFHAERSLKHSSHPPHPLTLLPYPIHQSGSFQCQSCGHIGHGMSYACIECQFDIHVHCALSPEQNLRVSSLPVQNDAQNYDSHMLNQTNPHINTQNFSPQYYDNVHPLKSQHPHTNTQNSTFQQQHPPMSNYSTPVSVSYTNSPVNHIAPIRNSTSIYTTNPLPPPFYPATLGGGITNTNNTIPSHYIPMTSVPFPHPPIYPTTTQNLETNNYQSRSPSITKHFSHPHALQIAEIDARTKKICAACECYISSTAYCCTEPYCTFNLHKSCFDSPVELHHTSHHPHLLKLVTSPPYPNGFTCDACCQNGKAFAYTCAICSYDLHIDCACWPEKMTMPYHEHELTLHYSSASIQNKTFFCNTCNNPCHESAWAYYCRECNFGTHLECVACELKPERVNTSETDRLANVYLSGLIAKQTQEAILELWDAPKKKKKKNRDYIW